VSERCVVLDAGQMIGSWSQ